MNTTSLSIVSDTSTTSMGAANVLLSSLSGTGAMDSEKVEFANADSTLQSSLSNDTFKLATGGNVKKNEMSASQIAITELGQGSATLTKDSLVMDKSGETATLSTVSLAFVGISPAETATLTTASLVVAAGANTATYSDTSAVIASTSSNRSASLASAGTALTSTNGDGRTTTYNNNKMTMTSIVDNNSIVIAGDEAIPRMTIVKTGVASAQLTQTGIEGLTVDGNRTMSLTTPTVAVNSATLASSGAITLDAANDVVLSAGDDSLTFTKNAMRSASAGDPSGQYLVVNINGTPYKILLLNA